MTTSNEIPLGAQQPETDQSEINRQAFAIQQQLGKMQTATLVRVDAVTNAGGVSPVGFVDVTPLVNQIDGQNNPTPHVTIFNIPYFRLQGGTDGIILDPKIGDIGICVFASRDISKVKATRKQANPGSFRKYHFSDGLYIGGVLNGTPSQYVRFSTAGIQIHSPTKVLIDAPVVQIDGGTSVTVNTPTFTVNGQTVLNGGLEQTGGGAATFSGSITATGDVIGEGISLHDHVHSGILPGGDNTDPPVP